MVLKETAEFEHSKLIIFARIRSMTIISYTVLNILLKEQIGIAKTLLICGTLFNHHLLVASFACR